jgi:hypothetical protein
MKKEEKGLTVKQEAFCRAVVAIGNQTEAYVQAFNGKNRKIAGEEACKLMATPKVAQRVKELQEAVAEKVVTKVAVNKAWITDQLVDIVLTCRGKAPLVDAKGEPTGEFTWNPGAANQALRLLGLEEGMFVEKKIVEHSKLRNFTPEQKKEALDVIEGELARRKAAAGAGKRKGKAAEESESVH